MTILSQSPRITRIDLKEFPNEPGIRVEKYQDGWKATSRPFETSTQREMTFEQMVEWLKEKGWDVIEWPASPVLGIPRGARAFKGPRRSVRTNYDLVRFRSQLVEKRDAYMRTPESYGVDYDKLAAQVHALDLAYEL